MARPFNKLSWPHTIAAAVIIGILVFGIVATDFPFHGVRLVRAKDDLRDLAKAIEEYRRRTGTVPTTEEGFEVMTDRPKPSPADWKQTLVTVPVDPWGNRYCYRLASRDGKEMPEVFSYGPDGHPGTVDDLSSLDPR